MPISVVVITFAPFFQQKARTAFPKAPGISPPPPTTIPTNCLQRLLNNELTTFRFLMTEDLKGIPPHTCKSNTWVGAHKYVKQQWPSPIFPTGRRFRPIESGLIYMQ